MKAQLDGLKQWKCPNGHVLGVVKTVKLQTRERQTYHVDRLMKYRHAIDPNAENPAEVEVDCEIEGTTHNICCDVPGCANKEGKTSVRTWWIGEQALERLLEVLK